MDDRVGLELDAGLDPGRGRVDDRHAGQHVRLVHPVAQHGRRRGELGTRVDPERCDRIRADVGGCAASAGDDVLDRVGQVELALRVVRVEPGERVP